MTDGIRMEFKSPLINFCLKKKKKKKGGLTFLIYVNLGRVRLRLMFRLPRKKNLELHFRHFGSLIDLSGMKKSFFFLEKV